MSLKQKLIHFTIYIFFKNMYIELRKLFIQIKSNVTLKSQFVSAKRSIYRNKIESKRTLCS
jgi:hypothetical protein